MNAAAAIRCYFEDARLVEVGGRRDGNRGVQLVFPDRRRLLIDSQRPEELDAVITSAG
jgi:hypothetical protein